MGGRGSSSNMGGGSRSGGSSINNLLNQAQSADSVYNAKENLEKAMEMASDGNTVVDYDQYHKAVDNTLESRYYAKFGTPDGPVEYINGSMVYKSGDDYVRQDAFTESDYVIMDTRGRARSSAKSKSSYKTAINGNGYRNFIVRKAGGGFNSYYAVFSINNTWSGFRVTKDLNSARTLMNRMDSNGVVR